MILDRYIFRLWLGPFAGGLILATGVLLLGRVLKLLPLLADSGAPWGLLGQLMLFVLPYFALLTIPIAFFLSMQNVIAGIQQSSEMDAMRAAGLSYLRIFRSLIGVAILLYLGLAFISMVWLPQGQLSFNNVLKKIYSLKGSAELTPRRFSRDVDQITFYVNGKDDKGRYHGVMVEDGRPGGPVYYLAEMAQILPVAGGIRLQMWNGTRLEGQGNDQRVLAFKTYEVSLPMGRLSAVKLMHSNDYVIMMTPAELWQRLRLHATPDAQAEWNRRLILPTTVLILCLFALPLSLAPKRAGRTGSLLLGIGLLILLYNVQLVLHRQVGLGTLFPWSMWAGQGVFLIAGALLWRRSEQGRLPMWLVSGGEVFYLMRQVLRRWLAHRMGAA